MQRELGASSRFRYLTDTTRRRGESVETAQESTIRFVIPAHIARTLPTVCSERIESPVISDSIGGVGLDIIPGIVPERRPREAGGWELRAELRHERVSLGTLQALSDAKLLHKALWIRWQHRFAWTGATEIHRRHERTVSHRHLREWVHVRN